MRSIIQVYLEYEEDVIRDIEISSTSNLEELHYSIITAFQLKKNELASFYITNKEFELLQEIPLLNVDEKENPMLVMNKIIISSILTKQGDQLLYVYDFMKMWRFLITLIEKKKETISQPKCIKSVGEIPKDAPEIIFEEVKRFDPFDEDIFDESNDYEQY
ncbi:plasmid pRiA4b ORF-3 family protein [Flavobacteriales bacterium]|nr:plasmid pRiA4b ORF-3 family protein [Flavobacteriales bacterium]